MALDSYSAMQGAITEWLARPDIEARTKDFITIAEQDIARRLKVIDMETIASTPMYVDQQYYSFPARFIELRNIYINTNPLTKLVYLTPEQLITEFPNGNSPPTAYTLVDGQIKLNYGSTPASGLTGNNLIISYYRKFDPLSDDNPTNWLTENASGLLLYGSLVAAEMYVVDDKRMPMWKQEYAQILSELNVQADKARHSGGALRVRQG